MVTLNAHGECVDIQEADQMQPAKSQFECGFFACAMARSMAKPGQPPTLSVQQVINDAEAWYAQYDGTDAISNIDGMSLPQEYALLQQIGLHYQSIAVNTNAVRAWVRAGYPVLVAVYETSVLDLELGNVNPYPWTPGGTHVILATGVTSDNHLLVRDSANCTNLYDPNSLRPGPRKYNANAIQLVSATAVVPPWMPRPDNATTPPALQEGLIVLTINQVSGYFIEDTQQKRWYLKSPDTANYKNNLFIGGDILKYYQTCTNTALNGMSQFGLPDGNEGKIPSTKRATIQKFQRGAILFDPDKEIDSVPGLPGPCYPAHIDEGLGLQLMAQPIIQQANTQLTALKAQIATLNAQISQLHAALDAADQSNHEAEVTQLKAEIVTLNTAIQQAKSALAAAS